MAAGNAAKRVVELPAGSFPVRAEERGRRCPGAPSGGPAGAGLCAVCGSAPLAAEESSGPLPITGLRSVRAKP